MVNCRYFKQYHHGKNVSRQEIDEKEFTKLLAENYLLDQQDCGWFKIGIANYDAAAKEVRLLKRRKVDVTIYPCDGLTLYFEKKTSK